MTLVQAIGYAFPKIEPTAHTMQAGHAAEARGGGKRGMGGLTGRQREVAGRGAQGRGGGKVGAWRTRDP